MIFGHTKCRIELNEKYVSATEGNNDILTVKYNFPVLMRT